MRVVQRTPLRIVGQRVVADWQGLWKTMPEAWKSFLRRAGAIPHRANRHYVDVSAEQTDGVYTQVIGAEVTAVEAVPEGMMVLEVPAQRYVHFRHVGPATEIATSFGAMYEWARSNGHRVDHFKLDEGYTGAGTETEHDLYIRILA